MKKWLLMMTWAGMLLASGGNEGGHGGDAMVSDIRATGSAIVSWLRTHPVVNFNVATFTKVLDSAEIRTTDEPLILDGAEKDAINYADKKSIVVNRARWRSMVDERQKWTLVIHEVLGLMRAEDGRYQLSNPIVEIAMPSPRNGEAFKNTMPVCNHFVSNSWGVPDGSFFGIHMRSQANSKFASYFVAGWVTSEGLPKILVELPIARDLACRYSGFHAGAMSCSGPDQTWFTVLREALMRDDSAREPYARFRVTVHSPQLEAHYKSDGFTVIDQFHVASTMLAPREWQRILAGKIPQFKSEMSWAQAELYVKVGYKAFGSSLSMQFGQESCAWVYPVREN